MRRLQKLFSFTMKWGGGGFEVGGVEFGGEGGGN